MPKQYQQLLERETNIKTTLLRMQINSTIIIFQHKID